MSMVQQIVFWILVTAMSAASADAPKVNAENVASFFDTAFSVQHQEHEIVGAVVSVVYQGEVILKRGYGYSDLEKRLPADPDRSLFRIASISKTFTWTALMQLSEQGFLDLNAEVGRYIDFDIPNTFDEPIRIWHLLTHTAGFEEKGLGMSVGDVSSMPVLRDYLVAEMPELVRPPGVHASYSNYASALAGYIVQEISGLSWADYVDQKILIPLGMSSTNTHAAMSENFQQRHAISYKFRGGKFERMGFEYMKDAPAGIMSTTAADMVPFMLAHLNDGEYQGTRILNATTAQQMRSTLFNPHEALSPILHGLYRFDRNGQTVLGHGGDINQFHSNMSLIPEHDLGLFVSFNSDPASTARSNLIKAFLDHFFPSEFLRDSPKAVDINLADYPGEYVPLRSNRSSIERLAILVNFRKVTAADDEIHLQSGNQMSRWIPVGRDKFVERRKERIMVFERNDRDEISHMLIGSPLGTSQRVTGLDAPGNIRSLLMLMVGISVFSVVGYGYRVFARASADRRLPTPDVAIGWLFALLLVGLYVHLGQMLAGDLDKFRLGMPPDAHYNLILMNINALIGIAVIGLAIRQWGKKAGSVGSRIRYSILAIAAVISLYTAYYFNILAYLFR